MSFCICTPFYQNKHTHNFFSAQKILMSRKRVKKNVFFNMKKMHLAIISTIRSRSVAVLRVFQNTCHYDKTYHEPLTGIYSSQSYPHICKDWLSENRFTEVE